MITVKGLVLGVMVATPVLAESGNAIVADWMASDWRLAMLEFEKEQSGIRGSLSATGQYGSSNNFVLENQALYEITDIFVGRALDFTSQAKKAGYTLSLDSVTTAFAAFNDSAIARIVTKIGNNTYPFDTLTAGQINWRFGLAKNSLKIIIPNTTSVRMAAPNSARIYRRFDLLGRLK